MVDMIKKIGFFLTLCTFSIHAIFEYDRAILEAQKSDYKKSQELLTHIIINQPEKADALYDLGVSAYKNKEFQTALSYFNKASNNLLASDVLKEQAHFNAGNTHVQLKQLKEAIAAYDRVLEKNPTHEKALHNKEVVKKMLEQEQQKQNQQDKNQDKNKQSADDKSQADKDKKNPQENKDKNNDQKDQDNNQEQENKNSDQDQNKQSADAKAKADRDQEENHDQNNQNQKEQNKQKNQPSNQEQQKPQHKNQSEKKETDQQESADVKDEKQSSAHSEGIEDASQRMADKQLPTGLARLLNEREKKDAQLNKQLTKALVANQGGGKNDYNCW